MERSRCWGDIVFLGGDQLASDGGWRDLSAVLVELGRAEPMSSQGSVPRQAASSQAAPADLAKHPWLAQFQEDMAAQKARKAVVASPMSGSDTSDTDAEEDATPSAC